MSSLPLVIAVHLSEDDDSDDQSWVELGEEDEDDEIALDEEYYEQMLDEDAQIQKENAGGQKTGSRWNITRVVRFSLIRFITKI